ncbi:MAG: hypothetical protein II970_03195 [Paludibacteraceae bacterium]|nr:hypothetical protein [Paludibacteraceae bacterium]
MRRFIIKTLLFALALFAVLLCIETCDSYITRLYEKTVNGLEIYAARRNAGLHKKTRRLLLGDSVAHQLYDENCASDSLISLTCNQAVSMAGHYFLLHDFLDNNRDSLPDEIILFMHPCSMQNNLDRFAFQYFLKPFWCKPYKEEATSALECRVKQIPLWWTAQLPFVKNTNYSPVYELPAGDYTLVSPVSYDYLAKIDSLARSAGIKFSIAAVPMRDDRQTEITDYWQTAVERGELDCLPPALRQQYSDSFVFLPCSLFRDQAHFHKEQIPADYLH